MKTLSRVFVMSVLAGLLAACAAPDPAPTPAPAGAALESRQQPAAPATATPAPAAAAEPTQPATPAPITVADGLGRTVSLAGPAQRIVSLAPSDTEILFAIAAGGQLVGRDDFSDYPAEAAAVPSIGSTFGELSVESIVGLEPDLVLLADINPPEHLAALEAVGLTVFSVGNPAEFSDLFDNLVLVGRLTGHEAEAQAVVDEMEARYQAVITATEGLEPVSLFYEVDGSDPAAPWTTGSGTFQQLMFDLAGGANVAAELQGWGQISLEELVVRDPQVIVFSAGPFVPTTVESLKARPGWGTISAVVENRVYAVDTDLLDLPGPRLVDGLEQLARLLHPEAFSE